MQENKSLLEHFEEIGRTISPKVQENEMFKKLTRFFSKTLVCWYLFEIGKKCISVQWLSSTFDPCSNPDHEILAKQE